MPAAPVMSIEREGSAVGEQGVAVNPQPVSVQSGRPLLECLAPATRAGQHVIELDLYSHRLTGCIFEEAIIMLEFDIQEAPCALQVSFRVVWVRGVACHHRFSINIIGLSEHHLLERVRGALPAGFEKTMENLPLERLSVTTHPPSGPGRSRRTRGCRSAPCMMLTQI